MRDNDYLPIPIHPFYVEVLKKIGVHIQPPQLSDEKDIKWGDLPNTKKTKGLAILPIPK